MGIFPHTLPRVEILLGCPRGRPGGNGRTIPDHPGGRHPAAPRPPRRSHGRRHAKSHAPLPHDMQSADPDPLTQGRGRVLRRRSRRRARCALAVLDPDAVLRSDGGVARARHTVAGDGPRCGPPGRLPARHLGRGRRRALMDMRLPEDRGTALLRIGPLPGSISGSRERRLNTSGSPMHPAGCTTRIHSPCRSRYGPAAGRAPPFLTGRV